MNKTLLRWATPGALLAAMLLAGCGGGGGGGGSSSPSSSGSGSTTTGGTVTGGGGTTTGGGGGGTTTGGTLTLTATAPATPGHGYVALTLPASTAATYTLQRAPAGTTNFATIASGLTGGTTYDDAPAGAATDPAVGSPYIYQVVSSSTPPVTSSATPPVTPIGPGVGVYFGDPSGNTLPFTSAPFTQTGTTATSGIDFQYRVSSANVPSVLMTVATDAAANIALSDIQSITIDGNSTGTPPNYYPPAQFGAALSVSGNVISLNTANLPANSGITVPVVPAGGLLTLNVRVAMAHGSSSYVVFQDTQRVPTSGSSTSTAASDARFTYELSNHF